MFSTCIVHTLLKVELSNNIITAKHESMRLSAVCVLLFFFVDLSKLFLVDVNSTHQVEAEQTEKLCVIPNLTQPNQI